MLNDDVLFRFRLRGIALARELAGVREACRVMKVHSELTLDFDLYPTTGRFAGSSPGAGVSSHSTE